MAIRKRIGDLLVEEDLITQEQLEQALALQKESNKFLGQILVEKGWCTEQQVYQALSKVLRINLINLQDLQVSQETLQLIPELLAVTGDILPISVQDNVIYLVMGNPRDMNMIQLVEFSTERRVKPLIAPLSQLQEQIRRNYKIKIGRGDQSESLEQLDQIGLSRDYLKQYQTILQQPKGMILVTGPMGSGKTTTLYASLNLIKQDIRRKIVSVEDPIESQLDGIKQIQLNPKAGVTYDSALSFILDRDPNVHRGPNVVLLGDMRDAETAEITFRVSETNHLVLSALCTHDAISTVTHLFHLGISPEMIASELLVVIAQRLVKRLCPHCKKAYTPEGRELQRIGIPVEPNQSFVAYQKVGCLVCKNIGYLGMIGLFEMFVPDENLRREIKKNPTPHYLKRLALESGMRTMLEDGIEKMHHGLTTIEEVARVCCIPCPGCGQAVAETDHICPFCHYQLFELCQKCGAKLQLEWRLCPFCGTPKTPIE